MGLFEKLKTGLSKTRGSLLAKVSSLVSGKGTIDDDMLERLEEIFISSDVGVETTASLLERIKRRVKEKRYESPERLVSLIKEELFDLLQSRAGDEHDYANVQQQQKPYVILIVGVNGVGKTTTIGKLAYRYQQAGYKTVIGAADTFRAAANEQLEVWAQRAGVDIVQQSIGSDPASVAFDTVSSAIAQGTDIVVIDTAGRLHTKTNLMEELKKIIRVIEKRLPGAPHEVLLVLDAGTGQNALHQVRHFQEAAGITGLVVTKLDGTAKGGVVLAVSAQLNIPVRYIGVGEQIDDLQLFQPRVFVEALFGGTVDRPTVTSQ